MESKKAGQKMFRQFKKPTFTWQTSVRINRYKGQFEKGYTGNWTREIFYVHSKVKGRAPEVYKLKDYAGDILKGTFYRDCRWFQSLLPDIDRILKRRMNAVTGARELYVSWKGYPKSFNQWIPESYVVKSKKLN